MANFIAKLTAQLRRIRRFVFRPSLSLSRHPRLTFRARGTQANADAYISWLMIGLADGSIAYNQKDAFVHFVEEGMLLATPKAIHVYFESNDYIYVDQKPSTKPWIPWKMLQRALQKSGYLAFNKDAKSHFHKYEVKQPENDRKRSKKRTCTCYLIPKERFETGFVPPLSTSLTKSATVLLFPILKEAHGQ